VSEGVTFPHTLYHSQDELAAVHIHDPLKLRLQLLGNAPRYRQVLQRTAKNAHWGETLPEVHYYGLAVYK